MGIFNSIDKTNKSKKIYEFNLQEIYRKGRFATPADIDYSFFEDLYVKKLLDVMEPNINYTTTELMKLLNMKSRISFRKNYLIPAIDNGVVKMTFPNTPTSKNQTYYKDTSF